jgi:poly(A) polymerase
LVTLPDLAWRHRPGLDRLVRALDGSAGATRYVGGAVRDGLLELPVSDLDLATRLRPDDVMERLGAAGIRAVPTGLAHGTVTAVLPDGPVEVTTLRRDISTDGRHAEVAFTDDWQADAARRDFTINALFADPLTGELFDYFGGLDDLAAGRVRFIGHALDRIAEDHLRLLRFFRFQARFGRGAVDVEALQAARDRAGDLARLSAERIAGELLKLLALPDPVDTVRLMVDNAVLQPILPAMTVEGVERLARLVDREQPGGEADPIRRLSALLPPDTAVAEAVAVRLKLSNVQRRRLVIAAEGQPTGDLRALAYRIGVDGATDRLLIHSPAGELPRGRATLTGWSPPALPLSGGDLIALGLPRGPAVAKTLARVEARWVEEGFPDVDRVRVLAARAVAQCREETR